ncbi:putative AHL-dependent transcriptional regulator, partial [Serratia symbiotica str. Tucson]
MCAQNTCSSDT